MPNYTNSVVYQCGCDEPEITDIYVGSTTNFQVRKTNTKAHFAIKIMKKHNRNVYRFIREHDGWKIWSMILIKKYPDVVDKYEFNTKERK
jgi:hypothetical protein